MFNQTLIAHKTTVNYVISSVNNVIKIEIVNYKR